jgi:hypothetical protein
LATRPHDAILDRDFAVAAIAGFAPGWKGLLEEIVNHGTNALVRAQLECGQEPDVDVAAFTLYRHALVMGDAIAELVGVGCAEASHPAVRSLFEALIALRYVLEDKRTYRDRALAWFVRGLLDRKRCIDSLDLSTERGRRASTLLKAEPYTAHIDLEGGRGASAHIQELLTLDHLKPTADLFEAARRRGGSYPHWHALARGPANLEQLAECVGYGAYYQFFYREWSLTAHAADAKALFESGEGERANLRGLRGPTEELRMVCAFTASMLMDCTRRVLVFFRAGEEEGYSTWYVREVQARYRELGRLPGDPVVE